MDKSVAQQGAARRGSGCCFARRRRRFVRRRKRMDRKRMRIPGVAVWAAVVAFLVGGACCFLVIACIFAFRGDALTAVLSLVATAVLLGGARFEMRMNNDYYLIDDEGVIVVRDGKQTASLRWEEFTQASIRRAPIRERCGCIWTCAARSKRTALSSRKSGSACPCPLLRESNRRCMTICAG